MSDEGKSYVVVLITLRAHSCFDFVWPGEEWSEYFKKDCQGKKGLWHFHYSIHRHAMRRRNTFAKRPDWFTVRALFPHRRHVQHRSHDLNVHCIVVNETCWASALIRKKSKTASSECTTFSGGCLKLRYFHTICNANSALMRTTRFRGNAWSNMTNPNFCHRRTAWKHGSN